MSSIRQMHTMVEAVLTLPDQAAAITRPPLHGDEPQGSDGELPHDDHQKHPGGQAARLYELRAGRP